MRIIDIVFVYQLKDKEDLVWHSRVHGHGPGEAELTYFMGGSGTFHVLDRTYRIFDNALFANTEGHVHSVVADDPGRPLSYYAVLFGLGEGDGEAMEICREAERRGPQRVRSGMSFAFEEMRRKLNSGSRLLNLSLQHQLLELIYKLPDYGALDERRSLSAHVNDALRYLQSHVADNVSLGDVARSLGLSESYLIRMFKSSMRVSPMRYYAQLRIEAAVGMLVSTSLSVKQIADRLSYSNEFHFSKQFKQWYGVSPLNYRKRNRIGAAPPVGRPPGDG